MNFFFVSLLVCALLFINTNGKAQTIITTESRCVNTGTATVSGTIGAGGPYQLSIITAPNDYVNTGIHSVATLPEQFDALYPGSYTMKVLDQNGTAFTYPFTITGNYVLPGSNDYLPTATAVTNCSTPNGSIQGLLTNGRKPYNYTIISGPAQVGTTNTTGTFTGLPAGSYQVQAGDSCQNLQTRNVTITASTTTYAITGGIINRISCDSFSLDALTVSPSLPAGVSYQIADYSGGYRVLTSGTSLPIHFKAGNYDITGGYLSITLSNGCGVLASTDGIRIISNEPDYTIANPVINRTSCNNFTLSSLDLNPGLPPGGYYVIHTNDHAGNGSAFTSSSLPINFTTTANNDIPDGWVSITVYDGCGNPVTYIQPSTVTNDWHLKDASVTINCATGVTIDSLMITGTITPPYTVTMYTLSTGSSTPVQTITSFPYTIPGIDATTNALDIVIGITDACGKSEQFTKDAALYINATAAFTDCLNSSISVTSPAENVTNPSAISYTISPDPNNVGAISGPSASFTNLPDSPTPYTVTVTDACGKKASRQVSLDHSWDIETTGSSINQSCSPGSVDIDLYIPARSRGIVTYNLYASGLPVMSGTPVIATQTYSNNNNGQITASANDRIGDYIEFSNLQGGTYSVVATDACGATDTVSYTDLGVHQPVAHTSTVKNKCINKGDIYATVSNDNISPFTINISDINDPQTIISSVTTATPSASNLIVATDLPVGTYIVQYLPIYCGAQFSVYDTVTVIPYVQPKVSTVQSFAPCSGGGTPVIVSGIGGVGPYMYEVVNSTPDNYTAPAQTGSVFTLPTSQTTVTVRVLDACLNSTTKTVAITKASAPIIRTTPAILSACTLPFSFKLYVDSLYQGSVFTWTKLTGTDAGTTVISNNPSLPIIYNSIADTGTYQVEVTVPNTCYDVRSVFDIKNVTVTCAPGLSGTVFDDANGLTDNTVNGSGTNAGGLNAILVDGSGTVVSTTIVANDGTYNFANVSTGNYSIVLSTVPGTPGSIAPTASLASNWINTGENLGAGVGNDGIVNGVLTNITVSTTSVSNADFGIELPPFANNVTAPSQANPGGAATIAVPALNGSDTEDGVYDGISGINTIIINTLPTNGTLYYNGNPVSAGDTILNYNPALLTVDPNDGAITVKFTYSEIDAAGVSSLPATVNIPFTTLSLSGNVYDDANGLTDGIVNGTGTNVDGKLYAQLINSSNTVIATVAINSNGTYNFTGLTSGIYSVVLDTSATASTITSLPVNWVNTGENIGADAGNDGIANGILPTITLISSSVNNANFGIDQLPNSNNASVTYSINTPDVKYAVPALTGSDAEDGAYANGNTYTVLSLPTNATLYYNAVPVTAGQTLSNFDASLLTIEPQISTMSTSFIFASVDAAGKQDPTPATITITWEGVLPVTLLNFTAQKSNDDAIVLNWTTSTEINTNSFTIERSTDNGKTWETIGAESASSNSASTKNYSFTDNNPSDGTNLYRLQEQDNNGSITYSAIKNVSISTQVSMNVYPNPVGKNETLNIQLAGLEQGSYKITLVSPSGQTIKELPLQMANNSPRTLVTPVNSLPSGTYIITINGNHVQLTKTVVVRNK